MRYPPETCPSLRSTLAFVSSWGSLPHCPLRPDNYPAEGHCRVGPLIAPPKCTVVLSCLVLLRQAHGEVVDIGIPGDDAGTPSRGSL